MVLTQAEEEGYSVFVIRKAGEEATAKEGQGWVDGGIGILPECEADRIAVALGEPVGRSGAQPFAHIGNGEGCRSRIACGAILTL